MQCTFLLYFAVVNEQMKYYLSASQILCSPLTLNMRCLAPTWTLTTSSHELLIVTDDEHYWQDDGWWNTSQLQTIFCLCLILLIFSLSVKPPSCQQSVPSSLKLLMSVWSLLPRHMQLWGFEGIMSRSSRSRLPFITDAAVSSPHLICSVSSQNIRAVMA